METITYNLCLKFSLLRSDAQNVSTIHVTVSTVGLFGEKYNYRAHKWPSNCSPWTPGDLRDYFWNKNILL